MAAMTHPTEAPFDAVAQLYDATFTDTRLGEQKRRQVHDVIRPLLVPGARVLEMNCGTGHDAIFMASLGAQVLATDISPAMLEVARASVRKHGLDAAVAFERLALQEACEPEVAARLGSFDLVLSDFDGINCVDDPVLVGRAIDLLLNAHGSAILVFMPPLAAMEILGNLLRCRFRRAFNRLRRHGIDVHIGDGTYVRTWFHSVGSIVATLPETLTVRSVRAIGLLLPPTSMRGLYERHQRLFDRLENFTASMRRVYPVNRLGDHVLLHIQRKRQAS